MPAAMLLPRHQSCKQSFSRFSRFFQRQPVVTTPFHHRPPLPTLSPTRRASSFALRPSPTPTPPTRTRRLLSTTPAATMASDDAYLAFLNKANQDSSEGRAATATTSTDSNSPFTTTSAGVTVPRVLQQVTQRDDLVYVSDADEPFYPVALKFSGEGKGGGLPDEEEFAKLIGHAKPAEAEVEILDPVDWDAQGRYSEVVDAVREAGRGADVRVYRVARGDGVRVEYWVVAFEEEGGVLVGVKALGVES